MKKERIIVGLLLASVGIMTIVDIVEDIGDGAELSHLTVEAFIATSSFLALAYMWYRYTQEKIKALQLIQEKAILKEIADKYQQKSNLFIEGLSVQIDNEFINWKLTSAERDVALFLLKGLSPKKIAEIRNSSEKTVRHQINSIYKKAGINGREEFSAYFLEDLLTPLSHES